MTVQLGDRGTYMNGTGGGFPGKVTNINEDGTVDVAADDGGQVHFIPVKQAGTEAPGDICFIPD